VCAAVAAVAAIGLQSSILHAASTLPDLGISASDYTSGMATSIGPWIAGGLGLAVVILAVILGWRKFKTVAQAIALTIGAIGAAVGLARPAHAQVTLPDLGIQASDYTSGMATSVGPWIAGGLGLAVVILAVILGWRKFKTVAR
jgi:hypothetical protein